MGTQFIIIENQKITDTHRDVFAGMLKAQGKVKGDLKTKADRCKSICFAYYNGELASIGALKRKTISVFSAAKADYTASKFQGKGLACKVVEILLESFGDENLMASTEISKNPIMVHILESNGFKLHGKTWKSSIHENYLGLFLKFK